MMSRSLVRRSLHIDGFLYSADDSAATFLDNMTSTYIVALRVRAEWVAARFDALSTNQLDSIVRRVFESWTIEFQPVQSGSQSELP